MGTKVARSNPQVRKYRSLCIVKEPACMMVHTELVWAFPSQYCGTALSTKDLEQLRVFPSEFFWGRLDFIKLEVYSTSNPLSVMNLPIG